MPWYIDPHSGGEKIPPELYPSLIERAAMYKPPGCSQGKFELKLRFRNQFCYLDVLEDGKLCPLGRFRYFSSNQWSVAFFTYSNERYQPCLLDNGAWFGSFEQVIDVCSVYLV